jgi:hypothetical protein
MIFYWINSFLGYLTRPSIMIEKYFIVGLQSTLPTQFDERSWYILFGWMTASVLLVTYLLSRCVTLKDADEHSIYQRHRSVASQQATNEKLD